MLILSIKALTTQCTEEPVLFVIEYILCGFMCIVLLSRPSTHASFHFSFACVSYRTPPMKLFLWFREPSSMTTASTYAAYVTHDYGLKCVICVFVSLLNIYYADTPTVLTFALYLGIFTYTYTIRWNLRLRHNIDVRSEYRMDTVAAFIPDPFPVICVCVCAQVCLCVCYYTYILLLLVAHHSTMCATALYQHYTEE